ncbi:MULTISPECIES: hypothetical protein [Francisella]|uniref:Uncharacterized protein n=1 Tax=Francisella adeliensis TaxID=2007306 RepID=A0A2Z4XZL8_9GAMM|nr:MULTISPECIES: hypothetical protein [Francisella]AXA33932.1 hypothetical protein CDH04_05655 [Francisella adeliensis]MBK2085840.1 hypothetical protein [Francisella adeliensis]MBK2097718.1 hypothetical protein [Francisella adeliensis]QIW12169.1 hypothetical protein FZC43_05660 [Francisella adeliensis]QIW14044.1 hypothetical protein FZC44_05660 [Francisella adeliensis]
MKLKKIITIAFGIAMIIPSIGFSEDYKQMLKQAQNQYSDQQPSSSENSLMSEYEQQDQPQKQSDQQANNVFKKDQHQQY